MTTCPDSGSPSLETVTSSAQGTISEQRDHRRHPPRYAYRLSQCPYQAVAHALALSALFSPPCVFGALLSDVASLLLRQAWASPRVLLSTPSTAEGPG